MFKAAEWMYNDLSTIRTLDYGYLPIATDTTHISNTVIDTIEMCNGDMYDIRRAYSGGLVAVKI